jgi:hypothetical protein
VGSYLLVSGVLFTGAVVAAVTAAALGFTLAVFPLLYASAWVVHGCAAVQRYLLRLAFSRPVPARYRRPPGGGLVARARSGWQVATWREAAYLVGLFPPLLALDTAVFAVWAMFLGGVSVPFWYDKVTSELNGRQWRGITIGSFPHGPNGAGGHGLFIDSPSKALLVAGACLVLFLLFNYVLVATARLHALVARAILRSPADPLAAAKSALSAPGPLGPLTPTSG